MRLKFKIKKDFLKFSQQKILHNNYNLKDNKKIKMVSKSSMTNSEVNF